MSPKPCSSNSEASHSADSTSASGVALPYFSMNRLSSEPALTPMRIGMPAAPAALATSPTRPSNSLMLPGFTRTAAQPASIAAKMYLGWKWMSAITGIWLCLAISRSASASSCRGHATLTMSQPVAVSSAICCSVALTSCVLVVVIDCTATGWSLPMPTAPTMSWRVLRRGCRHTQPDCGAGGHRCLLLERSDRVDDVSGHRKRHIPDHHDQDDIGGWHQPEVVHRRRGHHSTRLPNHIANLLEQCHRDVASVERQQRYQVDRAEHEVQLGQEEPERHEIPVLERVAADDRRPNDADRCLRIANVSAHGVHQRPALGRGL